MYASSLPSALPGHCVEDAMTIPCVDPLLLDSCLTSDLNAHIHGKEQRQAAVTAAVL